MKCIAIAFSVTRASSGGESLHQLVALEEVDGVLTGRAIEYEFTKGQLSESIDQLATFCSGGSTLIVHRAAKWRQLLRRELPPDTWRRVRPVLKGVFDIAGWSLKKFPRQRTSLTAICRRLQLSVPGTNGLRLDAQRLLAIASIALAGQVTESHPESAIETSPQSLAAPSERQNSNVPTQVPVLRPASRLVRLLSKLFGPA
jgi:hypothetical protein